MRQDDPQWFAVVRWTLMALIEAEELGLTSDNVDAKRASTEPEIRRFLGLEANLGQALGLPRDWGYQVVKNVGNYGEIFERTVGAKSDLKLTRGLNNLVDQGRAHVLDALPVMLNNRRGSLRTPRANSWDAAMRETLTQHSGLAWALLAALFRPSRAFRSCACAAPPAAQSAGTAAAGREPSGP